MIKWDIENYGEYLDVILDDKKIKWCLESWNGDQNHWSIIFLRSPNDWKEESVLNLLALLANTKIAPVGNDKIILPHDSKGNFIIKIFYREVCVGFFPPMEV